MNFLDKYSDMYYYLNHWNINAKVIILWIQEWVDIEKTNFLDVLNMRKKWKDTTNYEDNFYYHDDNEGDCSYFKNSMNLIKWIRKEINKDFWKEYFFTEIEPFPKPLNTTKLEDFYKIDEITDEKMRENENWNIRIKKIKNLLKWKVVLVWSHYYNNHILNDLCIDSKIYNKWKLFIHNNTLYIKVEHFSYLVKRKKNWDIINDEKLKYEIQEINRILSDETNWFKKFINNLI